MTKDNMNLDAGGVKADTGKPRFDLIPPELLFAVADILTTGAAKYNDRNWEKGMRWGRVFGAGMRHAWAWWGGKGPTTKSFLFTDLDDETERSHLWHLGCCVAFLIAFEERGIGVDDRAEAPKPEKTKTLKDAYNEAVEAFAKPSGIEASTKLRHVLWPDTPSELRAAEDRFRGVACAPAEESAHLSGRVDDWGVKLGDLLECTDTDTPSIFTKGKLYEVVASYDNRLAITANQGSMLCNITRSTFRKVEQRKAEPGAYRPLLSGVVDGWGLGRGDVVRCIAAPERGSAFTVGKAYRLYENSPGNLKRSGRSLCVSTDFGTHLHTITSLVKFIKN